jgi:hypothetical protein
MYISESKTGALARLSIQLDVVLLCRTKIVMMCLCRKAKSRVYVQTQMVYRLQGT